MFAGVQREDGRTSHANVVFEWLTVRQGPDKAPYRVFVPIDHLLHHERNVPGDPLRRDAPSGLQFSVESMATFAEHKLSGTEYKGVVYEQDRFEIIEHVPKGGLDIQGEPVCWALPCGRAVWWSLHELADATPDQVAPDNSNEAYEALGNEFEYDLLGQADVDAVEKFRSEPGVLKDEKWEALTWSLPAKETDPCWWLTNARAQDKSQPPTLCSRSIACLRLELHHSRCATSRGLQREWEERREDNAGAADVLHSNQDLWGHVGGPSPEMLLNPSAATLDAAKEAAAKLERMLSAHSGEDDAVATFAKECIEAVGGMYIP